MFRVVAYKDFGFTAYDVFCSFNKWAALAVFNRYNAFGFITRA